MSYDTLKVTRDDRGVVQLQLNRPDRRNALSAAMIDELARFAATDCAAPETRAVVLSGAGPVFCAGGDLDWMRAQVAADRAGRLGAARALAGMLGALNAIPRPLIGRIHGGAYGGGLGMACICDTVVAAESARFGLTETRLGLIPATIAPYVVARIGEGAARRIALSARLLTAAEAARAGIVTTSVPDAALDDAVAAELEPFLAVAPGAVARTKALLRTLGPAIDAAAIDTSVDALADAWEDEEVAHGIAAFFQKRPARWG
ncbi:MAG: crotonase/enoyl-CoA hydratase family protein [Tranquillimonas sp.]